MPTEESKTAREPKKLKILTCDTCGKDMANMSDAVIERNGKFFCSALCESKPAVHTPTPWEVQRLNHAAGDPWYQIGANGRGPIMEMVGGAITPEPCERPHYDVATGTQIVGRFKYLVTPEAEIQANARLIVSAVNSREVLVEALRRMVGKGPGAFTDTGRAACRYCGGEFVKPSTYIHSDGCAFIDAECALALAEEQA